MLLARAGPALGRAARGGTLNFAQAAALADSLAAVMDEVETQGADLARLEDLAPLALAEHWDDVTRFLDLIRDAMAGTCWRRKARSIRRRGAIARLRRWRERLEKHPPPGMVIAAGSTGSIPATADCWA